MKVSKKVLLMMGCTAILTAAATMGTIAYFSDTDADTNAFSVGSVKIYLDEKDTDEDDNKEDITPGSNPQRDRANTYHLLPGGTYEKDPTVHIETGSEDCYVYVTVDNQIAEIESKSGEYKTIAEQMKENGWQVLMDEGEIVKLNGLDVFVYTNSEKTENKNIVSKSVKQIDLLVFKEFVIDGASVVNKEAEGVGEYNIGFYNGSNIVVQAYAIQAAGFDSALAAWKSVDFGKAN